MITRRHLYEAWSKTRARVNRTGRPFIPFEMAFDLYHAQGRVCAISGLAFDYQIKLQTFVKHPFGASLDQKVAGQGYIPGNVQWVLTAVNFAKNEWPTEVFLFIAYATAAKCRAEAEVRAPDVISHDFGELLR